MNWDNFWIYRDGSDPTVGFGLFSKAHLIWLGSIALAIILCGILYCRLDERQRDNMRKALAFFLIMFEFVKQCVNAFSGVPRGFYLPMEICSMAEYTILVDALWPRNQATKQLMTYAFLPAAFMALMMPTANTYPPISFYAIHQLVMHAVIVGYIVLRYAADEIRPRYYGIWIAVLIMNVLISPVYLANTLFDRNYMFLAGPDINPVLGVVWKLTGEAGGFIYLLGLEVFVILIMHIVYLFFVLMDRILGR